MAIQFQCGSCGREFNVGDELAGRSARCGCGNVCQVPEPVAEIAVADGQTIVCSGCGKSHHAPPEMAGRRAQCGCGTVLHIPAVHVPVEDPFMAGTADDPLGLGAQGADPFAANPMGGAPLAPTGADPLGVSVNDPLLGGGLPQPQAMDPHAVAQQQASNQMLMQAQYEATAEEKRRRQEERGGAFSLEKKMLNGGVVGGSAMTIGGAVWFFAGLAGGYIFYYAPVLFVLGIISIVRGLLQ